MADDMKRVGLSFKTDGTVDFQKSLKQISEAVQGNREEFKRAKIAWDDSTTAMEKLTDRQKYLQKQTESDLTEEKAAFPGRDHTCPVPERPERSKSGNQEWLCSSGREHEKAR